MNVSSLLVFLVPSARAAGWRKAIEDAAALIGFRLVEGHAVPLSDDLSDTSPTIILSSDAEAAWRPDEAVHAVVIRDTAGALMTELVARGASDSEALHLASCFFSTASNLADSGAIVHGAHSGTLELPCLGFVRHPDGEQKAADGSSALGIYDSVPPAIGASARWPNGIFQFPNFIGGSVENSGQSRIDLTGRARTLVFGPYIVLPPGSWRVDAEVGLELEGAAAHLHFEWGAGCDFHGFSKTLIKSGIYKILIDKVWEASSASEFRIVSAQPHFHGWLEVRSVCVTRVT